MAPIRECSPSSTRCLRISGCMCCWRASVSAACSLLLPGKSVKQFLINGTNRPFYAAMFLCVWWEFIQWFLLVSSMSVKWQWKMRLMQQKKLVFRLCYIIHMNNCDFFFYLQVHSVWVVQPSPLQPRLRCGWKQLHSDKQCLVWSWSTYAARYWPTILQLLYCYVIMLFS